jgi:hypothetical protein
MADIETSLAVVFDYVWARFLDRLDGLEDDEYFWEPVPDSWSVRRQDDGSWRIDGDGGDGGPGNAPIPPPFTTIAWRIGHIGLTFIGFGDRLFSDGKITVGDVAFASSAPSALAFLEDSYRDYWRERMAEFGAERWWSSLGPRFGPYAQNSTTDLALHVLDELIHHAAEVGVLRDLYRQRDSLTHG